MIMRSVLEDQVSWSRTTLRNIEMDQSRLVFDETIDIRIKLMQARLIRHNLGSLAKCVLRPSALHNMVVKISSAQGF